ncbi:MARVEL domain-containing protein 2-like [Carcharodon carcharias]|uniref:MARVEL domain-containing protein 2-like n=1 Tax=Carcharodon carcharias TaxID=13397 RepID=UPI001B7EEB28|nr:MARVEL domain-containing protein 2-like [Carcharodon carcharias]
MSSDWSTVTYGYGRNRTVANDEEAEYSDPQRQMLPSHLMSNTETSTSNESDTFRAMGEPPPLPLQLPVGEPETEMPVPDIKPKRRFIPDSWKNFLRGRHGRAKQMFNFKLAWGVEEDSPPVSPLLSRRRTASIGSGASEEDSQQAAKNKNSRMFDCGTWTEKEMEAGTTFRSDFTEKQPESAQSYMERVHVYQLKHAYMKSWPGLLRVLGVIELLFGAMVFACICAYIQKDNQWYNVIGGSLPSYGFGNNYYYSGPKTPFVLVMAGLAWIVTVGLLVLGLTLYYRTILLDSDWWPLTEFIINTCLFFSYMAAGIVYINGFSLEGLCYTMMANSPLYYQLCQVLSGQIAAAAFLFVNMLLYLISAIVCLKVWRHEQTRREREAFRNKVHSATLVDEATVSRVTKNIQLCSNGPSALNKSIPAGYIPKPLIIPDYVTKYPKIESGEERERYKGVFNDQYAEYKELHSEIYAANKKFRELKDLIEKLPRYTESSEEHKRIMKIVEDYKEKINDPTFVEKKERCTYLKNKLSYIKQRIQEYDFECSSRDRKNKAIASRALRLTVFELKRSRKPPLK